MARACCHSDRSASRLRIENERQATARWRDFLGHLRIDRITTPAITAYTDKCLKSKRLLWPQLLSLDAFAALLPSENMSHSSRRRAAYAARTNNVHFTTSCIPRCRSTGFRSCPCLRERAQGSPLQRAVLPGDAAGSVLPAGRLLRVDRLREQEVSTQGTVVARVACRSRWIDGSTRLWIARRRRNFRRIFSSHFR
jgi:hypothetical protein